MTCGNLPPTNARSRESTNGILGEVQRPLSAQVPLGGVSKTT